MTYEFFLGANSSRGFYSLYSEFCSGEGDYIHIIKGGPGTGKSSFMRRIGRAAEEKGLDVEYVLCSGDPESLDGIYIPALHQGWVDGTAPHIKEPGYFGMDSDYVNLGGFFSRPSGQKGFEEVKKIYREYKTCYAVAYDYLKAATLLRKNIDHDLLQPEQAALVRAQTKEILDAQCGRGTPNARISQKFFHSLCCKGDLYLHDSLFRLCKQYYVFSSAVSSCSAALRIAAEEASRYVSAMILCPDPVEPELIEAVLLPELSLGFICHDYGIEGIGRVDTDALIPKPLLKDIKQQQRELRNIQLRLRALASEKLQMAKALHDRLESFYRDTMDFTALDEFTDEYLKTALD